MPLETTFNLEALGNSRVFVIDPTPTLTRLGTLQESKKLLIGSVKENYLTIKQCTNTIHRPKLVQTKSNACQQDFT